MKPKRHPKQSRESARLLARQKMTRHPKAVSKVGRRAVQSLRNVGCVDAGVGVVRENVDVGGAPSHPNDENPLRCHQA
jgi:hypothetical protein